MNSFLVVFQVFGVLFIGINCVGLNFGTAQSAGGIQGKRFVNYNWRNDVDDFDDDYDKRQKRTALNFGTAQSAGGIQGKRAALNFGTAQSAGGIQGKRAALNFGTAQSAGGVMGKRYANYDDEVVSDYDKRQKRTALNFGTAQSAGGIQG
ncbi:unnamed protein product [Brachionus calyciflorus]|uniref:Uncharacterized protein n=1 Tax=Brachionus calyciflorus TaxID=104777 RepID=A0A813SGC1_9BILA|nr:unnamed protein product [Brachionus calyciflorus]